MYENGSGINNEHDPIDSISAKGLGKYRFWKDTLYFSSRDNSSPQTNGKKYHVVIFSKDGLDNDKFTFGVNWLDYVKYNISDTVIAEAGKYIDNWFNKPDAFKGKKVIDVGCGSGLSSLCFVNRGASEVVSFDIDPNCVLATKNLSSMYYSNHPDKWKIMVGSVLDDSFIKSLGQYDIVHSWGVLHHTGNMWKAVENAMTLVKPKGLFMISLYSGVKTYATAQIVKENYNNANKLGKIDYIANYVMNIRRTRNEEGLDPHNWNTLQSTRGMNKYNDIVDWLGGLPYEVTDTATITEFAKKRGFKLINCYDPPNKACHEWLFEKL